jgi:hypothetical protein
MKTPPTGNFTSAESGCFQFLKSYVDPSSREVRLAGYLEGVTGGLEQFHLFQPSRQATL